MAEVTAAAVTRHLERLADPARAGGLQRFFKTGPGEYGEGDRFLGLTVPTLRAMVREYQELALDEVSELLESPWHEARLLALLILVRQYQRGDAPHRARVHRLYLRRTRRINNWDLVDCSAEHIVGAHVDARDLALLERLARSPLLWERRIAMLATFHHIKRGEFGGALALAAILLEDPHDLMHKAVGWMLREIGNRDRAVEETFLRSHAARMPRTMLRYAIEKFPDPLRKEYMAAGRNGTRRAPVRRISQP